MDDPPDDGRRLPGRLGWVFWSALIVGVGFVLVYAVGGCLMHTIC